MAGAYRHGVYVSEVPTKVIPPVRVDCGLPVVIGTAPVNMAKTDLEPNTPKLIMNYEEAVKHFGFSDDFENYTLSEFIYSQFVLFGVGPVVLVNVLDKKKHKKDGKNKSLKIENGKGKIEEKGIIPETLVIKNGDKTFKEDVDYSLIFDKEEIEIIGLSVDFKAGSYTITYSVLDPSQISKADIIGGIDVNTGKRQGLELVDEVYSRFGLVPGLILAPGYSQNSDVAAVMKNKANSVSGLFRAMALVDCDNELKKDELVPFKNKNNITDKSQALCYPKLGLGDRVFNFSTQLAGVINKTDYENGSIPYVSPSNKSIQADKTIIKGEENFMTLDDANYLNSQGIVTALNFNNGWKAWGNRTAAYPGVTDIKDSFIPLRRMFDWVGNTLILTFWQKIDDPMNKRLVETVLDSANLWLNGLSAQGVLLGARVEVLKDENPVTDLMDGIIRFHVYQTPPAPAREIDFIQEIDVNYFNRFIDDIVR